MNRIGVWFNGRTEVSKTFDEGSIPSTPATMEDMGRYKAYRPFFIAGRVFETFFGQKKALKGERMYKNAHFGVRFAVIVFSIGET